MLGSVAENVMHNSYKPYKLYITTGHNVVVHFYMYMYSKKVIKHIQYACSFRNDQTPNM